MTDDCKSALEEWPWQYSSDLSELLRSCDTLLVLEAYSQMIDTRNLIIGCPCRSENTHFARELGKLLGIAEEAPTCTPLLECGSRSQPHDSGP